MLTLENVSCGYGAVTAVRELSFAVTRATAFALLGPNGAGKTSTIQAVMGHVRVTGGRIVLNGQDIAASPATERARLGLAVVPEGRRLFSDMTVDENLVVGGYARARAAEARNRERVFALFPRLAERRGQIAASLSGGEQQMLAFGRALMTEPRLLLVDELSLGLMPKAISLFIDVLTQLKADGVTIVLVEQNTSRALQIADAVCVLASGRSVFQGSSLAARNDMEMFERYLGIASAPPGG